MLYNKLYMNSVDPAHEIGENVTITDKSQLRSITPEQAIKIKSLRIENQVIDDTLRFKLLYYADDLYSVYFVGCNFFEGGWLVLNCAPTVSEIGFVNCLLSVDDLDRLLSALYPHHPTEVLDLTGNRLGDDPLRFVKCLSKNVFNFKSLSKLVISGNGFCPSIVPLLKETSNYCVDEIVL